MSLDSSSSSEADSPTLHDLQPSTGVDADEVLAGLRRTPKQLACKLFYDERGSRLFDRICELPEYYPTRTEAAILRRSIGEITTEIGPRCLLVEYGSGSSSKTRVLLDHLRDPAGYLPIDISKHHLMAAVKQLRQDYPSLKIYPVCADYSTWVELPDIDYGERKRVVFFPGSTIGNFDPSAAEHFLRRISGLFREDGGLLIGVDLKKDPARLEAAYDDSQGVTADFNKNVLLHLNRTLGANFDPDQFDHLARYDQELGRIEMHLVSRVDQEVVVAGTRFSFAAGERLHTENSYKYDVEEFGALAQRAGFAPARVWTDDERLFSVHYLTWPA